MQTFFTRSSRTYGPTCSLSNSILSTTKATASANNSAVRAADYASNLLFRKFGGFYERFYSTMSDNAGRPRDVSVAFIEENDICGSEKTAMGSSSEGPIPMHDEAGGSNGSCSFNQTTYSDHEKPRQVRFTSPIRHFKYSKSRPGARARNRNPLFLIHPTTIEKSIQKLSMRLGLHDRLIRALEREIERRKQVHSVAASVDEKSIHSRELRSLQQVYAHITQHFYDADAAAIVMKAIEASQSRIVSHIPPFIPRPYVPPFPHYTSIAPPVSLNKAMLNLFDPPIPLTGLLMKISYNLLTSSVAPDITTYNILIRGFVVYRQNSLAHMVFQSLVDSNLVLDDYSLTTIVNLCVKSGDYDSFRQVANVLKTQPKGLDSIPSKVGLEALISAAAKFGKLFLVSRYSGAIKRYYPGIASLSPYTLTILLKLHTEKRDWPAGMQVWERLKGLDTAAKQQGKQLVTDLRAYRQMASLCRACGKAPTEKRIMSEALRRGWDLRTVCSPVEKTKGLHFTSEVKVPRLVQLSGSYQRFTRRIRKEQMVRKQRPEDTVLGLLERVFDDDMIFQSTKTEEPPHEDVPAEESLERVLLPWLERLKEARPELRPSKARLERSKLWNDIVSRRIGIVREGMLNPTSGKDPRGTGWPGPWGPEWKPDLTAYQRGSE